LRRMTLQLRHIFFTEADTFMLLLQKLVHFARNTMRARVKS
jgi:hypothetical protein